MAGNPLRTTILMMAGYAGSGKTTLANEIQSRTGINIVSKDELKRANLALGLDSYRAGWEAHLSLLEQIKTQCFHERKSVIIDCGNRLSFLFETLRNGVEAEEKESVRLKTIVCVAPQDERARRIKLRGSVFAPYITILPHVRSDEQMLTDFSHLLGEHEDVCARLSEILKERLFLGFESFLSRDKNLLMVNTTNTSFSHECDIWQKLTMLIA